MLLGLFQNLHDLFKDQVINVETLAFSRLDLSLVSEEDFDIFSSLGMFRRGDGFYGVRKNSLKHKLPNRLPNRFKIAAIF